MTLKIFDTKKLKDLIADALLEYDGTDSDAELEADKIIDKCLSGGSFSPGTENFKELLLQDKEVTEDDKTEWAFWEGVENTVSKMMEKKVEGRISEVQRNVCDIGSSYKRGMLDLSGRLHALEQEKTAIYSFKEMAVINRERIGELERKNNIISAAVLVSLVISLVTLLAS